MTLDPQHAATIAQELSLAVGQVCATAHLLDDNATIAFVARYRKEATGNLDEVAVTAVRDRLVRLRALDERRAAVLKSLEERGVLTDELRTAVMAAPTMAALEDAYLPFRPKRRTRAMIAREKGLEPLAILLLEQGDIDPAREAQQFIDDDKGVASAEDALAGARDIIAELVSEHAGARARMRGLYAEKAVIGTAVIGGKEEAGAKFRDYFSWQETAKSAPSHRVLAMRRGEKEEVLLLRVTVDEAEAVAELEDLFMRADNAAAAQVRLAVRDSYRRLLSVSMETEARLNLKTRADEEAVRVFADNLRQLLMSAPLGQKRVLAIDPGFRTGCKVACLDAQGGLLHHDTVFPHEGRRSGEAEKKLRDMCSRFAIEYIAIGNGTAGRETDSFVRTLDLPGPPAVVMVSESGASVYSASEAAREEFPDHDLTVRGAVSIGRRLMDPLAELVKIEPRAIGVGQYQHDVDQRLLKDRLDDCVMSCVNQVGVELNTASRQLLTYVSGVGPRLADKIIERRNSSGPFASRQDLLAVPGLGPKAFEQAAGFLRIRGGSHPLDASAVHPESYPVVAAMAADLGRSISDLLADAGLRKKIDLQRYVTDTVGMPTLRDIMAELDRPGRDPRERFEAFSFQEGIAAIEDLEPGMRLPGIVTNITNFGAFVDVGVHQDGLVHISELADRFVKSPAEVVKLHQQVTVTVLAVDVSRRRISLSLRAQPRPTA